MWQLFQFPLCPFSRKVRLVLAEKGVGHELVLQTRVHRTGDQLTASTHFVVPYVAWGMKNPSTLFLKVSDTVEIDLSASGSVTTSTATSSQ